MKRKICIDFCDFHANYPKTDNFYFHLLNERFDVRICDQPDFLFFGPYGQEHRLHSGVRIFVSIEPGLPDFRVCDYSVTCRKVDDPRHLQLPSYVTCGTAEEFIKKNDDPGKILAAKTRFCGFVVSGHHPRKNRNRLDFFQKLSKYKRVDSGGRFMNNMGGPLPGAQDGKIAFLRTCKFNIAFENSSWPGYTTEKIYHAMAGRCLPIYWGDPLIGEEFNTRSFLNYADFPNEDALIEKIIELDKDDAKYLEYGRQPYFYDDTPNLYFDHGRLLDFFENIFSTPIVPAARRQKRKWLSFGRWMPVKRHHQHPLTGLARTTSIPE